MLVLPSSLVLSTLKSPTKATRRNIPEHGILHITAVKISNLAWKQMELPKSYDFCVRFEVFHGGDYEECRVLGCDALWLL
jgi:hypothetical protein